MHSNKLTLPDIDRTIIDATIESLQTGKLTPLLKQELKLKIQSSRLAQGKEELQVKFEVPQKQQLTPEEEIKRQTRKERNRVAARRCRVKNKTKAMIAKEELEKLMERNKDLKDEVAYLEEQIIKYRHCPCPSSSAPVMSRSSSSSSTMTAQSPCLTSPSPFEPSTSYPAPSPSPFQSTSYPAPSPSPFQSTSHLAPSPFPFQSSTSFEPIHPYPSTSIASTVDSFEEDTLQYLEDAVVSPSFKCYSPPPPPPYPSALVDLKREGIVSISPPSVLTSPQDTCTPLPLPSPQDQMVPDYALFDVYM